MKQMPAKDDGDIRKYLGYALPRAERDTEVRVVVNVDFHIHDVPLRDQRSFLDYDGVVLFAGTFERIERDHMGDAMAICAAPADLDLRERQFFTAVQQGRFVVFLVPGIPNVVGYNNVQPRVDLFRRIMNGIGVQWRPLESPVAHSESLVPEFRHFIESFGVVHTCYNFADGAPITLICAHDQVAYGFSIADKTFVLPCAFPETHEQAVEMAAEAIRAVVAYRQRVDTSLPEWIGEFAFRAEAELVSQAEGMRAQLVKVEADIDGYGKYKGALCFRSDPLVQMVKDILHDFFDLDLVVDDKKIEDAQLKDGGGKTLAVFDIKGVNGNFVRENVNQADSHRERLGLPVEVPAILIMNTLMSC